MGTHVSSNWREGSTITYQGEYEGKKYQDNGVIKIIEPEKIFQSTYWSSMSGKEDKPENYKLVTYTIKKINGKTVVTVSQDNNSTEKEKMHSVENWKSVLRKFKEVVESEKNESLKKNKMKTSKKTIINKSATKKIDPVVHFEMPAEDRKRMAKFYAHAFGWQTQMLGEDMGNYVLATTTEVDKTGGPKKRGIINGGFYAKNDKMPAQYPSVVISVDDIKKSINKVVRAGGKVIGDPKEIPGFGLYVSFFDTEGNRVSIMEPTLEMKQKAQG